VEAAPLIDPARRSYPPRVDWPVRSVRLGLTTFYPWSRRATHQLRYARDRRGRRSI